MGPDTIELYKTITDFRQEDIAEVGRNISESVKQFKKPVSVFARWKADTEDTREKCTYGHDFTLWKLERFVKDNDQRNKIEACIFDNFYKLKSMFLEIVSETSFPMMSQLGWH
jgi:hypothetical protein